MLGRRKKGPAPAAERAPGGGECALLVGARARPGAFVPPELKLPEKVVKEVTKRGDPPIPAAPPGGGSAKKGRGKAVVLVTGFEPFAGEAINPSWEICERLPAEISG